MAALIAVAAALAGCGGSTTAEVTVTRTSTTESTPPTTPAVTVTDEVLTNTAPPPVTTAPAPDGDENPLTRDYTGADRNLIDGVGLSSRECRRRDPDRADGERAYIVCVTGRVATVYVRLTGRAATVRDWNTDRSRSDANDSSFDRGGCSANSRTVGTWTRGGRRQGRFYCGLVKSSGSSNLGWTYAAANVTAYSFPASGELPLEALDRWWTTQAPSRIS